MDCRAQLASLAIGELDKGDFQMATKILTTGIRIEPNNHELYFERSICHHKLGDYQASLDDANTAIRLNSADYNIHYQKGLALIGLSMFAEAVTSFKKAIELRAKQDDSKLSDIFKLLRDATNELNAARRRPGLSQTIRGETLPNQAGTTVVGGASTSNDPVDSTTDRPHHQPGASTSHHTSLSSLGGVLNNGNSNLVATNQRNIQPIQVINGTIGTNRVSSSASHINSHPLSSINLSPEMSSSNAASTTNLRAELIDNSSDQNIDATKSAQYDWNIRRSERIFLHHSNDSGAPGTAQFSILPPGTIVHQRQRTGSNPSSINSNRSATKRLQDNSDQLQTYQLGKLARSKDSKTSLVGSDVDVDDSYNSPSLPPPTNLNDISVPRKRVMIAPSSSMSATSQGPSTSASKDDSYSSKYKRLRRDRERARRGTSKLCTIKQNDLEELQKQSNSDPTKRFMRVIAPIDGWLYSGQLSIDDNGGTNGDLQYVVKLDGDATGSSYLFSQDTVLTEVIKEVKVKSVSELRKGARICCYWSRQYKCLSTGVVTSRTFEATKSLVSVKYDNGDLSAVPLEDLRLLPPDYPKYMSNCDPLLLARNGDSTHVSASNINQNGNRIIVECKLANPEPNDTNGFAITCSNIKSDKIDVSTADKSQATVENTKILSSTEASDARKEYLDEEEENDDENDDDDEEELDDEDGTIPPTNETIDFIASEDSPNQQNENQHSSDDCVGRVSLTKDNTNIPDEIQLNTNGSRTLSEENSLGIEYRPWKFDGPPRRSKRHGRIYRDNYTSIRRGNEVIRIGDSAELMPRDVSTPPFIAKIDGFWATSRGEMRVRVRWYYRLMETDGEPSDLPDGENALFETDHVDENDVQSIYRSTQILPWTDYNKNILRHENKSTDDSPKIFYLAGYYDPVRRVKHLRSDVKEAQ